MTAAPEGLFHPGPIEDTHGTVAFALPTGHVGVVTRQGSVRLAKVRDCQTPVGLTPAGPNRLLVACSSGQLISVRQRPSRASKP